MPKRSQETDTTHDDIPELDEVVAAPAPAEPAPPPNLDLFAGAGVDLEAVRDALTARLGEEIDAAFADLRVQFETLLRERVDARLRERLPEIVENVLGEVAEGDGGNRQQ